MQNQTEMVLNKLRTMAKGTVLETLGIEIEHITETRVVLTLSVTQQHTQLLGYLHGGVSVLLAETAASILAALGVDSSSQVVFGQDINASHLHSVLPGAQLTTIAQIEYRGRSSVVCGIEIHDERERKICVSRCTVAIRARRQA